MGTAAKTISTEVTPKASSHISIPQPIKKPSEPMTATIPSTNQMGPSTPNKAKVETLANKKLMFVQDQISEDIKAKIFSQSNELVEKTDEMVSKDFDDSNYRRPSQIFKNDSSTTFLNAADPSDQVEGLLKHERTHINILVKQGDEKYVTHILISSKKDQLLAVLQSPRLVDEPAIPEYKQNEEATTYVESKPYIKQLIEMSAAQSIKDATPTMRKLSIDSSFYNEAGQKSNIETTHTDYKNFFDTDVD